MINSVLVICTGNICRSPMAEGMLKKHFEGQPNPPRIQSAGIAAVIGEKAHPSMLEIAEEMAIDLSGHIAQQATQHLCVGAELILTMENGQTRWLESHYPQLRGRVFLLGRWNDNLEIPDPIGKNPDYFRNVSKMLHNAASQWKERLE